MKHLIYLCTLLLLMSITSCKDNSSTTVCTTTYDNGQTESSKKYTPIYKEGEIVYVAGKAFIVTHVYQRRENGYELKVIDCHSDYCKYDVLETEISKTL